jgi:predicted dehydrogenase
MIAAAVLGLGSIGLRHAGNLQRLGASVIGFDPDESRRAALTELGGRAVLSRDEAVRAAEAVVVASPNACHLADLQATAATGRHVFVEKPIAHTEDGLNEVLEAFSTKGRIVFAGLILRFHPAVRAARELIAAGELGAMLWARLQMSDYLPAWRPMQDHRNGYTADPATGGVLFDVIHEFDLANFLLGPGSVAAAAARNTGTLELPVEDCADVVLRHESGPLSAIHVDYVTRPRRRVTEVAGTLGVLEIDLDARRLRVSLATGEAPQDKSFSGSYAEDFVTEMKSFLDCVAGRGMPPCDGREAAAVLRQVIAARQLCGCA